MLEVAEEDVIGVCCLTASIPKVIGYLYQKNAVELKEQLFSLQCSKEVESSSHFQRALAFWLARR